jgi:hypothetical protein
LSHRARQPPWLASRPRRTSQRASGERGRALSETFVGHLGRKKAPRSSSANRERLGFRRNRQHSSALLGFPCETSLVTDHIPSPLRRADLACGRPLGTGYGITQTLRGTSWRNTRPDATKFHPASSPRRMYRRHVSSQHRISGRATEIQKNFEDQPSICP